MNVPFMVVHGLHYILGPRESNQPLLAYNIHVWRARNRIAFQPNHFFFFNRKKKKEEEEEISVDKRQTSKEEEEAMDIH